MMPRPDTPPVVAVFRDENGHVTFVWADGRSAVRFWDQSNDCFAYRPIARADYAALWPAPAPEPPIADMPVWYGTWTTDRLERRVWVCRCEGHSASGFAINFPEEPDCPVCRTSRPPEPTP